MIVFNSLGLNIDNSSVGLHKMEPVFEDISHYLVTSSYDRDYELYYLHLDVFLEANSSYTLTLRFNSKLGKDSWPHGFYWNSYIHEGQTR